jgi:glycine hydroxymethyltransferase
VFFATVKPGDRILSLDLAAGGHLSHGAAPNQSGRWFDAHHYGVERDTGLIDYDRVADIADEVKPQLLITGGSAYPRIIDFARMREIADAVGALLLVDMAHFAGLVAAGVHPSPLPFADLVTCTTTKTMRGPRGGLILARDAKWAKPLQSAIFPGVQGSLHSQIIAAKAVCLGEALRPDFKTYGQQVVDNARALARVLSDNGIDLVSGGTDTHIVLLDFSSRGLSGQQVQDSLVRLGVAAATTRGLDVEAFARLGEIILRAISRCRQADDAGVEADRQLVAELCRRFPIYP